MGYVGDNINNEYNNKKTCFKFVMLILSIYWFVVFVLANLLPSFNYDIVENIPTSFLFIRLQPFADGAIAELLASFFTNTIRLPLDSSTENTIINISYFVLGVTCIINFILHLICASKIFGKYSPQKSSEYVALYIIFNIIPIIPFIPSVCLWKSSNNKPVSHLQN